MRTSNSTVSPTEARSGWMVIAAVTGSLGDGSGTDFSWMLVAKADPFVSGLTRGLSGSPPASTEFRVGSEMQPCTPNNNHEPCATAFSDPTLRLISCHFRLHVWRRHLTEFPSRPLFGLDPCALKHDQLPQPRTNVRLYSRRAGDATGSVSSVIAPVHTASPRVRNWARANCKYCRAIRNVSGGSRWSNWPAASTAKRSCAFT